MVGVNETQARESIVELGRSLFERRVTPGRTGNLSVRLDDAVLMTPTGSWLGRLDPERLAVVDLSGRHLSGDPPTKELPLHLALYRASESATAVAHVHSTAAVTVSCLTGRDSSDALPALTAYYRMRVARLPLVPYHPPGDPGLADALAAAVGTDTGSALLANHGSIAAAGSLDAAVDIVEEIEETARVFLQLAALPAELRPGVPGFDAG